MMMDGEMILSSDHLDGRKAIPGMDLLRGCDIDEEAIHSRQDGKSS